VRVLSILSLLSACSPVFDGEAAAEERLTEPSLLVVAPDDLVWAWAPFVDWKRSLGVPTVLEPLSHALDGWPGADDAARLKARLAEAWSGEGTVAILLAGDVPDMPFREVTTWLEYALEETAETHTFASDLYFADLDSNWDTDADGAYAEASDGPDLRPDVALGRVTAATGDEVAAWYAKVLAYEQPAEPAWLTHAMLMGELAATYGGVPFTSSGAQEALILPLFPDTFEVTRLYSDYERYDGALPNDAETQRARIEAGQAIILDLGHGNEWWMGRLSLEEVWDLPDVGRPGLYTTVECSTCGFDTLLPVHTACEAWLLAGGGGAAFLGNTDLGIGFPTLTAFYMDFYTRFFEEDPSLSMGRLVLDTQRSAFDPAALLVEGGLDRWAALTMVYMGDPTLIPWRGTPRVPEVEGLEAWVMEDGENVACVEVTLDGDVLDGATASFYRKDAFLRVTTTDAQGQACAVLPDDPGGWTVTVSGTGLVPVSAGGT
jgi:hypothetical protein